MSELVLLRARVDELDFGTGTCCGRQAEFPVAVGSSKLLIQVLK